MKFLLIFFLALAGIVALGVIAEDIKNHTGE